MYDLRLNAVTNRNLTLKIFGQEEGVFAKYGDKS